jgi:hypothetical protein
MADEIKVAIIAAIAGLVGGLAPAIYNYVYVEKAKHEIEERQASAKILVDDALKDIENRKVEINLANEVRGVLQNIYASNKPTDIDANAISFAMYGRDAALLLIQMLEQGSDTYVNAAMKGLRVAGERDLSGTCSIIINVLKNRTRLYKLSTHKHIIELLTVLDCPNEEPALREYRWLLDSTPQSYAEKIVVPQLFTDKMAELKADVDKALARFNSK